MDESTRYSRLLILLIQNVGFVKKDKEEANKILQ